MEMNTQNAWKIGDAVFNVRTRYVWGRTCKTRLGRKDADLLKFLIRSYEEPEGDNDVIVKPIWGLGKGTIRSLYKSIQKLRDAFGGLEGEYICTDPYRLVKKPEPTSWPKDEASFIAL